MRRASWRFVAIEHHSHGQCFRQQYVGGSMQAREITSRFILKVAITSLAMMLTPIWSHAQDTVLSGSVTDSSGGVLPGVTVTATHAASGNTFLTVTDGSGAFRLPLRTGAFEITV